MNHYKFFQILWHQHDLLLSCIFQPNLINILFKKKTFRNIIYFLCPKCYFHTQYRHSTSSNYPLLSLHFGIIFIGFLYLLLNCYFHKFFNLNQPQINLSSCSCSINFFVKMNVLLFRTKHSMNFFLFIKL